MSRLIIIIAAIAFSLGALTGFLWWGLPNGRLRSELQNVRASADRLSQQMDDVQNRERDLTSKLALQKIRMETTDATCVWSET